MTIGVLRLPGDGNAEAAARIAERLCPSVGASGRVIGSDASALGDVYAVIVPGVDDRVDAALDTAAAVLPALRRFAAAGGPVLGIGAGFRLLCEVGLLDGALEPNEPLRPVRRDVDCVVEGRPTPFSHAIPAGRQLRLRAAHVRGRFVHPAVETLEAQGRVVLRYCSPDGEVEPTANPDGSIGNIAGICNAAGQVVGVVPHPDLTCERPGAAAESGLTMFACLMAWRERAPARV